MSVLVVDASVVLKWFVPEIHSDAAHRLLERDHQYFAPDLVFAETANAIWKKFRRGELSAAQGQRLVKDLTRVAVETVPSHALAEDAYAIAIATGHSVYDSLYLTLAMRLDTRMVTGDERLASKVAAIPALASYIQAIQDVP